MVKKRFTSLGFNKSQAVWGLKNLQRRFGNKWTFKLRQDKSKSTGDDWKIYGKKK